ncbi:hypothetical protein EGW08_006039 [Elysia chlorotica]|uniref:C-type lectin domain-containing protein n=1 Tax=Elysia chlorotica TaxID=188477 RepID=A0A3S1HU53_ELYCH|nr:hypothetical protein EGW08_006039 [Elysia chlorotica]
MTFTKVNGPNFGSERLGSVWNGLSLSECGINCWTRYSSKCQTFLYNSATGLCTAGSDLRSGALGQSLAPPPDDGHLFAASPCNTSNGFRYVTSASASACILTSDFLLSQIEALQYCQDLDAILFEAPEFEKLELLPPGHMYTLGLTDAAVQDVFVWLEAGLAIDAQYRAKFFQDGDPNNYNQEDCIAYQAGEGGVDYQCGLAMFRFACERPVGK